MSPVYNPNNYRVIILKIHDIHTMELFNNKVQFVLNMDLQNKQLAEYSDLKFHCPSKYKTPIKQDALFLMLK